MTCVSVSLCVCVMSGQNNQAGKSILKTDYKEDGTINDNLKLSVKILLKTLDSATPSPERIELSVLKKGADGKIVHSTLSDAEVKVLIDEIEVELEEERKKAEAAMGDI